MTRGSNSDPLPPTSDFPLPTSDFSPGPFPGLRPFRSDEYHLFFGREEQTAELLALLREHRFLAVVGTSGSGKSSLVRAGLIPALHRGTMTRAGSAWEVVLMRPGGDPVTNLARALIESELYEASDPESLPRLKATLTRSLNGLVEAVRQSEDREPNANLLVVVDQFEEVFRFRSQGLQSAQAAGAFVRLLLAGSEAAGERLYVAITMRSDYLGDCAQIPGLAEAVNHGEYLIPRLSRDQKRDAIEKPVGVGSGQIAPRLVQRMLNDVGDDPDQLPVLQHALMRSWDHWAAGPRNAPLDLEHYRAVGGMEEALSRHADEVYSKVGSRRSEVGSGEAAQVDLCEKVFRALTVKGADNRGVRRPTRLDRLAGIVGAPLEEVAVVVEAFRRPGVTFLMPGTDRELQDSTVVDLSHESLMRVWTRLREWVEEEAQSARIYRRLSETAELWKEGRAGLFRDPDLQIALAWRERAKSNAEWADQYGGGFERAMEFLDRSRDAAGAEARALEGARRRELEQAQALAEAERQRAEERQRALKRSHKLAAVVGLVALIAVIASFIAVSARREALENAALARVSSERAQEKEKAATDLAAQLKANFVESDYQQGIDRLKAGEGAVGLSYLARALRTDPEYRPALARALGELASGRFSLAGTRTLQQERVITSWNVFREEGLVHTSDYDGRPGGGSENFVWDVRTGQKLYSGKDWKPGTRFYSGRHAGWYGLLDPDRRVFRCIETRSGSELGSVKLPRPALDLWLRRTPEEARLVLVEYDDHSIQLWHADRGEATTPVIPRGSAGVLRSVFTPDCRRFLAFYDDQAFTVHETLGGKRIAEISTAPLDIGTATLSPRGDFVVVTTGNERRADWWPVEGGSVATPASGSAHRYLEFSGDVGTWMLPSGDRVSFYWEDPRTRRVSVSVHDLKTRQRTALFESEGPVAGVMYAFDDQDKFRTLRYPLFGFLSETRAQIWDLESGAILQTMTSATRLGQGRSPDREWWNEDILLSPDGRSLATVSVDHGVMLWDPFTGRQLLPKGIEHRGLVWMTFSPDGGKLVTFEEDRRIVQVWDSRDGRRLIEPVPLAGVPGIEFTHGGSRLVLYDQMQTSAGEVASKQTVGKVVVIDLGKRAARPEPLIEPNSYQDSVARYTRDGKRLVVARETNAQIGNQVLVFDAGNRRLISSVDFPPGVMCIGSTLQLSADGSRLAVGSDDGSVRVFEIETGGLLQQLALSAQQHEISASAQLTALALSPDGVLLAAGSEELSLGGKLSVFDLATGALRFEPLAQRARIDQVQFSPDGKLLAITNFDARFHLVGSTTGVAVMEPLDLKGLPEDFAFSSDGAFIALAPFAPEVQVFDVAARKVVRSLPITGSCRSAVFSPDGRLLAVGSGGNLEDPVGQVTIWDFKEGRKLGKPLDVQGAPSLLQFNEDGSVLATGTVPGTGGKVHVWGVPSGNLLLDPVAGAERVASVSLRSGGRELAAAWDDGAVRIIDLPPQAACPASIPRLLEAVAGARLVSGGNGSESVPREELQAAKAEVLASTGGPGSRERSVESWTRWFAADPESRGISPGSKLTGSEYLARISSGWRIPDFEDAIRFEPSHGPTFARMGLALLDELNRQQGLSEPLRRHFKDVARWHGRRAVSLSPGDPETWAMGARIFKALGNEEEAAASLARALELDASRPERPSANLGLLRTIDLAGKGKWEEADREFGKVVEAAGLLPAGPGEAASPLWGSLPFLIPFKIPAQFRDLQLGEPLPGTFEDFDSVPEGQLPAGWTASADLDQPPGTAAGSPGGLAATDAAVFQNWVTLSASRVEAWTSRSDPDRFRRAASPQWIGNVNGAPVSDTIEGGFLAALSPSGSSRVQRVTTGDFDCSGRSNVQLVFRSLYLQTEGGLGAIEYSIDGGSSWLPAAYLVAASEIVRDSAGKVDAAATLEKEETGVPRLFDAQGRLRGGKLAAFVAAPIGPGLSSATIGRLPGQKAEIRRIEAYRLPSADGQPRVRLRFTHLGKAGGLWCLDHLGLYDRVSEDREGRDRVLQPGLNPRILAGIGWENFTRFPPAPGSSPLFSIPSSNRVSPLDPAESPASGASPAIARWQRLEGSLYLRRARALAPGDPGILLAASAAAARDGILTDGVGAERAALAHRHLLRSAARPLAAIYAARATALKAEGDGPASAVADEIAYLFCEASGEPAGMELNARMASAGLLTESRVFVPFRSSWSYFDRGYLPDPRWKESGFDDGNWPVGPGRLGYGGDGETTTVSFGNDSFNKSVTTYFRSAFEVADPDRFADLTLRVRRDDGVVVYLNGQELLRDNLPGGEIGHDTLASSNTDGEQEQAAIERMVTSRLLRKGRNVLSAEVHQASPTSSDIGFDLEVSASGRLKEPAVPPADLAAVEERLGVPAAIRAALWTTRARAFRLAGKAAEAREALDRAAGFVPGYPALAYEEALLLDARGEGEPAYQAYLKAVDGAIALKADPGGPTPLFLPRTLKDSVEPLIAAGARELAWAAGEIGSAGGRDGEKEVGWLLRRSAEIDPQGPEGLRGRLEAFGKMGRVEEALRALDQLHSALSWDQPAAPRRAREIKELLGLKERLLEQLSRGEEAKRAREEIFKAPPRDPSLSLKLIDLSTHYNASLYDGRGWHTISISAEVATCLKALPETFEPRGGLRFDLRGMVQLNSGVYPPDCHWPHMRGKDMSAGNRRQYPDAVTGIKVGTRAGSLHFVVSAIYCRLALTPAGTEVARFVVHYADGGQEVVPLLYAVDLAEWWFLREEFQLLDPSRVIWKNPAGDRQLDLKSWKNPRPDQIIESLDFVSAKKPCSPFVVAITAE